MLSHHINHPAPACPPSRPSQVLREVWSTQFDHVYVDEALLGGMRRARAAGMDELLMFLKCARAPSQC